MDGEASEGGADAWQANRPRPGAAQVAQPRLGDCDDTRLSITPVSLHYQASITGVSSCSLVVPLRGLVTGCGLAVHLETNHWRCGVRALCIVVLPMSTSDGKMFVQLPRPL